MLNSFLPLYYLRVLVIDDELKFLARFKATVKGFGHEMEGTSDPKKAVVLVENSYKLMNPFDVVFIDYLMPDMNGVEVAKELLKIDPELILIAITRDQTIKTKMLIIDSMVFRLFIPKNILYSQLKKLFNVLISTKIEQYSGSESPLSRKLAHDQQQAKRRKRKDIATGNEGS